MTDYPNPADRTLRAGPSADPPAAYAPSARMNAPGPVIAVGGDARQVTVIGALHRAGHTVYAAGLSSAHLPAGVRMLRTLNGLHIDCTTDTPPVLLLPLPLSRDGNTVSCPLDPEAHITLDEVRSTAASLPGVRVLGGCLPAAFRAALASLPGIGGVWDYYEDESVQLRNARLTAEGAVMTAMELTDTALVGSRAAVFGYGRIGKCLARLLTAWDVRVTVFARRPESCAEAETNGCDAVLLRGKEGRTALGRGFDVIYNTIPVPLPALGLPAETDGAVLIIDLASHADSPQGSPTGSGAGRPEGTVCAQVVRAPSLPGRYAPRTAGRVLADAVTSILSGAVGKEGN